MRRIKRLVSGIKNGIVNPYAAPWEEWSAGLLIALIVLACVIGSALLGGSL